MYDILLTCFLTWILFQIKLLQTALHLPLFEKCSPLNMTERAEGLFLSVFIHEFGYLFFTWVKGSLRRTIKKENQNETLEKRLVSSWLNLNILQTFF